MTEPTNSTEIPNDLHDESSTIIEPQIPEHIEHTNNHEHDSDDFDDDFDDDEFEDDSDSDLDDDFKSAIYSLHDFIVEHDFFNTQVNYTIGNQQISLIIIRKPITKYITRHLKSYIKIKQSAGRTYRVGSKSDSYCILAYARDTDEERIINALIKKDKIVQQIVYIDPEDENINSIPFPSDWPIEYE